MYNVHNVHMFSTLAKSLVEIIRDNFWRVTIFRADEYLLVVVPSQSLSQHASQIWLLT